MDVLGIPEDVLMERASLGAWTEFRSLFPTTREFAILCGPGSNGGDGIAMARHAVVDGFCPTVVRVGKAPDPDGAAGRQLAILAKFGVSVVDWDTFLASDDFRRGPDFPGVDALFGTGLKRALQGDPAQAADWLSNRPTLALDLPSGLDGTTGQPLGICVKALATVTFARAKPGLFLHPGREFAGDVRLVEIGIAPRSWQLFGGSVDILDASWAQARLKPRARAAHKGDAGRGFLLCGSDAYLGAAILAASAALRSGLGLATLGSTESVASRIALAIPETMGLVAMGDGVDLKDLSRRIERADAVLAGPGMGTSPEALTALSRILERTGSPLVLDADGLNLCAMHPELRTESDRIAQHHGMVLTPHPLEASRLMGESVETLLSDPLASAKKLADRYGAVVVLKSATPVVASPAGELAIGVAGHSGMALGGCGDALAGALVARLAEGESPFEAACQAVRAHARAGDLAGAGGHRGMSVTDLISRLPAAWEEMEAGI